LKVEHIKDIFKGNSNGERFVLAIRTEKEAFVNYHVDKSINPEWHRITLERYNYICRYWE